MPWGTGDRVLRAGAGAAAAGWSILGAAHAPHRGLPTAAPSVRAISATFGNSVQVASRRRRRCSARPACGIHVALVSLHALTLLTVLTALVELDLSRERRTPRPPSNAHLFATLAVA